MKNTYLVILTLSFLSQVAFGQSNNNLLRGVILYQNSKGKPAVGVEVSGTIKKIQEHANSKNTDDNGAYELKFPRARAGHLVEFEVGNTDRTGQAIEVVNDREVAICLIPNNVEEEFKIIVCPKGQRDSIARIYYNIIKTSADIALAEKKKKFNEALHKEEKDHTEIDSLQKELERLEKQTDSISIYKEALRIASINKDDANDRVKKYIQMLEDGKTIQEAIKVLDRGKATSQLSKSIKNFKAAIEELEIRASASSSIFDYKDETACYDSIIYHLENRKNFINPLKLAEYYNYASLVREDMGQYKLALEYGLKALSIRVEKLNKRHRSIAESYGNIGNIYNRLGQFEKSLEYNWKALNIDKQQSDNSSLNLTLINSYSNIAASYKSLGNYTKGLEYGLMALELYKQVPPDSSTLATIYNNIAGTYRYLGNYKKGLEYMLKSVEIQKQFLDSLNPKVATAYNNMSLFYIENNNYSEALEYGMKALDINLKLLDSLHPNLALSYDNIGYIYSFLEEYSIAFKYQEKALAIYESILDSLHPNWIDIYASIGENYSFIGKRKEALIFFKKALRIQNQVLDSLHPKLFGLYDSIAEIYKNSGDIRMALKYEKKALSITQQTYSSITPFLVDYQIKVAETYKSLGNIEMSLELFLKTLKDLRRARLNKEISPKLMISYGAFLTDEYMASIYVGLGRAVYYNKKCTKAIQCYQKAIEIDSKIKEQHYYNDILGGRLCLFGTARN